MIRKMLPALLAGAAFLPLQQAGAEGVAATASAATRAPRSPAPRPAPAPAASSDVRPPCTKNATASNANSIIASAVAGDVVCLSGSFSSNLSVSGRIGTASAPITIQAATVRGTTLYSLEVKNSPHVIVRDFVFRSKASTLLKLTGSPHAKVLRNDFDHSTSAVGGAISQSALVTTATVVKDASGVITSVTASDDVEIAYNAFHDHLFTGNDFTSAKSGSFIKTQVDTGASGPVVSQRLHIHHNHFRNMAPHISAGQTAPDGDSDREAIVFGTSASAQLATHHVVEHNLFEDCDGENEIITVKTSNNVIRHNTFRNSFGSLSIRFGTGTEVYGNFFFGEGASAAVSDPNYQTGGIRVYGTRHRIYNNYMQGLTGTSWRLPILIDAGDSDSPGTSGHQRPQYVEVTNNTVVNSAGGIQLGSSNYSSQPRNNVVANNLVVGSVGTLIFDKGDATNTWQGNIVFNAGSAVEVTGSPKTSSQVRLGHPAMVGATRNGYALEVLSAASIAVNAGVGSYPYVVHDMDGEGRGAPNDVGADEYSAHPVQVFKPLRPGDVGPGTP